MSQFWNEINIKKAYARGVSVACRLRDFEQTAYFIRKIDWREKDLQVLEDTLEKVIVYFTKVPFGKVLFQGKHPRGSGYDASGFRGEEASSTDPGLL